MLPPELPTYDSKPTFSSDYPYSLFIHSSSDDLESCDDLRIKFSKFDLMSTFQSTDASQPPGSCKFAIYKQMLVALIFLFMPSITLCQTIDNGSLVRSDFTNPPASVKIHTWWHWINGAITKEGITKDLESMQRQGISQATILNVGLFDGRNFSVPQVIFDSPQWYEMFRWALHEASRLKIKIGVHNCDGWSSSGGPWISPEMSMKQYVWTKTILEGGKTVNVRLKQPMAKVNFYKDVAVVAFKTSLTNNSFQKANPKIMVNDSIDGGILSDGNQVSGFDMRRGDFITMNFNHKFAAGRIAIYVRRPFMWRSMANFNSNFILSVSDDGRNYKKVQDIEIVGLNKFEIIPVSNLKSRFYKLQVRDFSSVDPQYEFTLAEVELLGKNDPQPNFSAIPYFLEKTVSLKSSEKSHFDAAENSATQNLIPDENSVVDITKNMGADGSLSWAAPAGNWSIIRFGYTTTGKKNEPATKEGTGFECDKMDTAALGMHFRSFPQKLVHEAGQYNGNTFKFLLIDSWECMYQNWTAGFLQEFEKQQGYSLIKWIPALCGETIGSSQLTEGFLYDFRKTIANLIEKNYYLYFSILCHKVKLEMHCEVIYGDAGYPPVDVLKSNTYADLPMWEFWAGPPPARNFPEPYVPQSRIAGNLPSYAANCYQLPIVAAESYTSWAHYSESPFYLKPFGDRAFCQGVNQLILHSYVHQPTDQIPGMTLSRFGAHLNRHNSWWSMTSDWFTYQNRVQYLLQKGETASDVLYFLGDQLPQFTGNQTVNKLPFGYRPNGCNFDVLQNKTSVRNGKIAISQLQNFALLILPDNPDIELASLKRIAELVSEGAVIYGKKPNNSLSLKGKGRDHTAFKDLTDKLWGMQIDEPFGEKNFGKGKIVWGKPIDQVLKELKYLPDLETNLPDSLNLQYIHKKVGQTDLYFVVNQQNMQLKRQCIFRVENKIPEIWNPQTGTIQKLTNYSNENGRINIPVTFAPYESLVFVFDGVDLPHQSTEMKSVEPEISEISEFAGTISFSPAYPANITPVEITELKSWTDFVDPAIKYFSGKANYTIHFKLSAGFTPGKDSVLLSLGRIGVIGGVQLNGRWLGNLWLPDFRMDVTNILKPDNELKVEVANVYRNRIIGDLIEYGRMQNLWTTSPVETYFEKDKYLHPSGLLGPMRLIKFNRTNNLK